MMTKAEAIARAAKFYEPYTMSAKTADLDAAVDRLLIEPSSNWWFHRLHDLLVRKDLSEAMLMRVWDYVRSTKAYDHYGSMIALHRGAGATLLALIAEQSDYEWTLRKVAFNPKTPAETLWKLLKSGNLNIRVGLAKNPEAPSELLRILSFEKSTQIQNALEKNPAWNG